MIDDDKSKTNRTWEDGDFAPIVKAYKNLVLSGEYSVATQVFFWTYLQRGLKKPGNMIPKAFNNCFEVLCMLYHNLKTGYEPIIWDKEKTCLFFNAFSAEDQNKFVQQQK